MASIASSSFCASALFTAAVALPRSVGVIEAVGSVLPLVPTAPLVGLAGSCDAALPAADAVGLVGLAGLVVEAVAALGGIAASLAGSAAVAPPADCWNAFRCWRNSTSLVRIAGSRVALPAAAPAAPVAPVVPVVPLVPAVAGVGFIAGLDVSAPSNAVRFASSFAYDARQFDCVVISSLKFEMICDTCVRASPCSLAASGSDVSWLSDSRAAVRCSFAAA